MTIVYAIILLLVLITVHEFGHFMAARLTGIPVREFAIGMGPKIASWKSRRHDTLYSLRIIPFGGFCAFVGEDDRADKYADHPDAFGKQAVWKRLLTVFMGAGMNFILALLAALLIFSLTDQYRYVQIPDSVYVHEVTADGPAGLAGIEAGDQIIAVNGFAVDLNITQSLVETLNAQAALTGAVDLSVLRDETVRVIHLVPRYEQNDANPYKIGIIISSRTERVSLGRLGPGQVLTESLKLCGEAATAIFEGIHSLLTSPDALSQMSGPVGIVTLVSDETAKGGLSSYIFLLVVISMNLGIMNLLPVPGLDGSRILFMLLELLRGKPIAAKKEAAVHLVGYALLFGLLILLTYHDIAGLFSGG
jgi:regulator of sigma E protease